MAMRTYEVAPWGRAWTGEASSARVAVGRGLKAHDADRKARGLHGIDATLHNDGSEYNILNISVHEVREGEGARAR